MAEIATGSFTHTLEQIDDAVSEVSSTIGESASLTAAVESIAGDAAATAAATAAASAIADLDVSSVGGSGKYISAIKQVDGKIDATPTNLATSVTDGGAAAVTSGAVYTALSSKISMSDILGQGVSLADYFDGVSGADRSLNALMTAGVYYASTGTVASGIYNSPYTAAGYKIIVMATSNNNRPCQILIPNPVYGTTSDYGIMYKRHYVYNAWQAWYKFSGEAVSENTPPASLNSINTSQLQVMPPDDGEESEDR